MVSAGIHLGLLLLFLFLVAWRAPNPPLPEYGIELNFGFDDAGSGSTERDQPAPPIEDTEEVDQPDSEVETETIEEVIEEPVEEVVTEPEEEVQPETPVSENETPTQPEEQIETPEEPAQEEIKTEEVQETPAEVKAEEIKEEVKEEEKATEQPVTTEGQKPVEEETKPETKPQPVIDKRALMGGGKKNNSNSNTAASNNEGNSRDEKGNQGDPEGAVDERGLLKGGGKGGPVLELTGWTWSARPNPNDQSNESGKIIFKIRIDDRGEVVQVVLLESTVSAALVRLYQKEVEKVTFKPLSSNSRPAPFSEGKITFVIKAN